MQSKYGWVAVSFAGMMACSNEPASPRATTDATIGVVGDFTATAVRHLVIVVSSDDHAAQRFDLPTPTGHVAASLDLQAGTGLAIAVSGYDSGGTLTHRGQLTLDLGPGMDHPDAELVLHSRTAVPAATLLLTGVRLAISSPSDTLVAGGLTIHLTALLSSTTGEPLDGPVSWESASPMVATVDSSGEVQGLFPGTAVVHARVAGGRASDSLHVLAPDGILPTLQLVAGGLAQPVFVTSPPGDSSRVFVVLQGGPIRIIRNDTLLPGSFLDLTGHVSRGSEQGVLGMAFHPHYATNGLFFVHFTNHAGDTRIVRYRVSAADPAHADPAVADTIFRQAQPYENHNGGMLLFGPDGYLYIGMGDGGSAGDPHNHGQTMTSLLGKMLRVDVDGAPPYAIPPSNPFVGQTTPRAEIWASGLRNPWRFSFDRATGALFIADVGQGEREEINIQPAASPGGQNYGWRLMEGLICFVPGCSPAGLTLPALEYTHADGCSVTGGYVYRGRAVPIMAGHYFYADYCRGWVRSFRVTGGMPTDHRDWSAYVAPGGPISSFGEDARGELYIVEHGANGAVYRIVPVRR